MKQVARRRSSFRARLVLSAILGLFAVGCDDDETPTGPDNGTTTTTAPAGSSTGLIRAAQLTIDARNVDVAIDGNVIGADIAFPGVSPYVELAAGQHRVQFFPAGTSQSAILETNVTLNANEALTVAIVGSNPLEIITVRDDRSTSANQARVRLFNAVPDFPAPLDLAVVNGPLLISNVPYQEASGYEAVVPGAYAFTLRRGGTVEDLATLLGAQLPSGTTSTVFAVGSLTRNNIQLFVARDAG